jgi:SSS family solute:Na+ symporter
VIKTVNPDRGHVLLQLVRPGPDGAWLDVVKETGRDGKTTNVTQAIRLDAEGKWLPMAKETNNLGVVREGNLIPAVLDKAQPYLGARIGPNQVAQGRSIAVVNAKGVSDQIIPTYITTAMPKWFGLIFLLTLLAAAMSTLSSQFHTIGTAIGRDVLGVSGRVSHERSVLVTRVGVVLGIVVSVVLARTLRGNIIAVATAIFFGLCAATFLPAFVAGVFWRRMTRAAALWSMVVGFAVSLLWLVFVNGRTAGGLGIARALFGVDHVVPAGWSVTWTVVDPLVVALPLSALTAVVVARLTRPMDPAHVAWCFGGPKPRSQHPRGQ